jgi:hypothetical protein
LANIRVADLGCESCRDNWAAGGPVPWPIPVVGSAAISPREIFVIFRGGEPWTGQPWAVAASIACPRRSLTTFSSSSVMTNGGPRTMTSPSTPSALPVPR